MNNETGEFETIEQAQRLLRVMLKQFAKDGVDHPDLPEYLTSKINIIEVAEDKAMVVEAQFRSAQLDIHLPIKKEMTKDEIRKEKIEVLVQFSSMLDQMKTKTLIEIYKHLKECGRNALC